MQARAIGNRFMLQVLYGDPRPGDVVGTRPLPTAQPPGAGQGIVGSSFRGFAFLSIDITTGDAADGGARLGELFFRC